MSLNPIYNRIDEDETNSDFECSEEELRERLVSLERSVQIQSRTINVQNAWLWFMFILLVTFVALFAAAMLGALRGRWAEILVKELPRCQPPDGFVHSFEDVIKTLNTFTCEKALDVVNTLHVTTMAKCWDHK
jgi:hypothetical protein